MKENPSSFFSGKPLDIWALGVTLFIMTFNRLPIKETNEGDTLELLDLISKGEIVFPEAETRTISEELKKLMLTLFEKDPEIRITSQQIKKFPWFNKDLTEITEEEQKIIEVTEEDLHNSLKFFRTLHKMVKCILILRNQLQKISDINLSLYL